jgi:putative cell wall-binding protein
MRRIVPAVVLVLVGAAVPAVIVSPTPAVAVATVDRLAGADRYETAAVVATSTFTAATDAVVARGDTFPDALAASGLAGSVHGPVLLTTTSALPESTSAALRRLGVQRVHLVGSERAVGATVERALREDGYDVRRYGGSTRYDTAARVGDAVGAAAALDGKRTVLVVSGETFPDALAAGPVAFDGPHPLLLTAAASLPSPTAAAIGRLAPERVVLVGGTAAVSTDVEQALRRLVPEVHRYGGLDRGETAALLAWLVREQLGWASTEVDLARGDAFADALAAAPHAASRKGPVLLPTSPVDLGWSTRRHLHAQLDHVGVFHVLGGPDAVSDGVVDDARRSATKPPCPPLDRSFTGLSPQYDGRVCVELTVERHGVVSKAGVPFRVTLRVENRSNETVTASRSSACALLGGLFVGGRPVTSPPTPCQPAVTSLAPGEVRTITGSIDPVDVVGLADLVVGLHVGLRSTTAWYAPSQPVVVHPAV